ncbi:1244_t:CDS:2, partial [Dentiscutata heterogama]
MSNPLNETIEKIINERIKQKYDLFSDFEEICKGPFGIVRKATWGDKIVVLKSLNSDTNEIYINAFVNELQNHIKVDGHEHQNIIQFYGVTKGNYTSLKTSENYKYYNIKLMRFTSTDNIVRSQTHKHEAAGEASQSNEKTSQSNEEASQLNEETSQLNEEPSQTNDEASQINEETSTIITKEHKEEIISWINPSPHDTQHELKLIFKGSRDGFEKSTFYNKCKNIDNTIIILKVLKTGEIFGGYNPLTWKVIGGKKYKKTDSSFIFSLKTDEQRTSTLIKVKNKDFAICCLKDFGPSFGYLDLFVSGNDLKTWKCCQQNYEKAIKVIESETQYLEFQIEDYE